MSIFPVHLFYFHGIWRLNLKYVSRDTFTVIRNCRTKQFLGFSFLCCAWGSAVWLCRRYLTNLGSRTNSSACSLPYFLPCSTFEVGRSKLLACTKTNDCQTCPIDGRAAKKGRMLLPITRSCHGMQRRTLESQLNWVGSSSTAELHFFILFSFSFVDLMHFSAPDGFTIIDSRICDKNNFVCGTIIGIEFCNVFCLFVTFSAYYTNVIFSLVQVVGWCMMINFFSLFLSEKFLHLFRDAMVIRIRNKQWFHSEYFIKLELKL